MATLIISAYQKVDQHKTAAEKEISFISCCLKKHYTTICLVVLEHILTHEKLSFNEKRLFILLNLLATQNYAINGKREVIKSATYLASMLGVAESAIFALQKSLEEKGYLVVKRRRDADGLNEINCLIPTLPKEVFNELKQAPDRNKTGPIGVVPVTDPGYCLAYLDSTKLFVPLNPILIVKMFAADWLGNTAKLLWFSLLLKSHITDKQSDFFIFSHSFLAAELVKDRSTISKAVTELVDNDLLKCERLWAYQSNTTSNRKKHGLWKGQLLASAKIQKIVATIPDRAKCAKADPKSAQPLDNSNKYTKSNILKNYEGKSVVDNLPARQKLPPESSSVDLKNNILELKAEYEREFNIFHRSYGDLSTAQKLVNKKFSKEQLQAILQEYSKPEVVIKPKEQQQPSPKAPTVPKSLLFALHWANRKKLQPGLLEKIRRFAGAIKSRKVAQGYAENLSLADLLEELIHHVANWQPTKIACSSEQDRQNAALSFAWRAIANGNWQCPYEYSKTCILEREHEAFLQKVESGYEPPGWHEHCIELNKMVVGFS